ncbi:hypothetical protein RUND412_005642 [Rhizina undulata]
MASRTPRQVTSLLSRPPSQRCLRVAPPSRQVLPASSSARRCLHQQAERQQENESDPTSKPKNTGPLEYTLPRRVTNARPQPRAPFPVRNIKPFKVNDDSAKLDAMYERLLGGRVGLKDEVKWQAVTHKSFDHGRQPFNEKLSFLGKRIVYFHASVQLLNGSKTAPASTPTAAAEYKSLEGVPYLTPEPFTHENYRSLDSITNQNVKALVDSANLEQFTRLVGIQGVMRWQPANERELWRSGLDKIAIECLFAIVGAVALQKGGDVAGRLVTDRIFKKSDY